MALELILPNAAYRRSYGNYILELGEEDRYPFSLDFEYADFPELLDRLSDYALGKNIPEGFVPSTTFWLVDGGELVGVSNLRHCLNDRIKHIGGHIGLGIRPSCRARGLGTLLMGQTLQEAARKGIMEVHIHCYKDNPASAGMIEKNGGVLDSEIADAGGQRMISRYVVAAT